MKRSWHRFWSIGLVGVLVVVVAVTFLSWPRDVGRELRRATFNGELKEAEELLRRHPELVNQVCANPSKSPVQNIPPPTSAFEGVVFFTWEKIILSPLTVDDHDEEFFRLEMAQLSPLEIAIVQNHTPLVRLLLEQGADVKRSASHGMSSLYLAANKQPEIIGLLLKHGADARETNRLYGSPLMSAVHNRDSEAVRLLLAAGADPNVQTSRGATPLHSAIFNRSSTNVLLLLLEKGARPDLVNRSGKTALDEARHWGITGAVEVLSRPWPAKSPVAPTPPQP